MVVLMDFYADWCGPCKQQDPILKELEEELEDEDFEVQKIDVDDKQDVANQYDVRSIPTLVLKQDEDSGPDELIKQYIGVTQKEELLEDIREALNN